MTTEISVTDRETGAGGASDVPALSGEATVSTGGSGTSTGAGASRVSQATTNSIAHGSISLFIPPSLSFWSGTLGAEQGRATEIG